MQQEKLIFAYNADQNLFSKFADFAHKLISPSTYECRLCHLTHTNFGMRDVWKEFIENLPIESRFTYKDEFVNDFSIEATFPAVFILNGKTLTPLIEAHELQRLDTLQDLRNVLLIKLDAYAQRNHSNI